MDNPDKQPYRKRLSPETYRDGILAGDRFILSRAITLIESTLPSDNELAVWLLAAIEHATGNSTRIGITGVPGVGKSTFIESFGEHLVNEGNRLAILTIDPSSSITGGSIMGDKTRMDNLVRREEVYIRPSPSGRALGGVAIATRNVRALCEAAGFNVIIIETVGVGQSETAVKGLTDFFLLLMLAGAGDELQGMKRGIMEMADSLLITKADGQNLQKAKMARLEYANAFHLMPPTKSGWTPEVQTCSAITGEGIGNVWHTIQDYVKLTQGNGFWEKNRHLQNIEAFHEVLEVEFMRKLYSNSDNLNTVLAFEKRVASGESATAAAHEVLKKILKN